MKLLKKLLAIGASLLLVAVIALALLVSHDSACPPPGQAQPVEQGMAAVTYRCYGPPEVLQLEQVAIPPVGESELLIKVQAAGVNPLDWHYMRGSPYIMRLVSGLGAPDNIRLGVDFSGTVEAVGSKVTRFKPGDQVFGGRTGAFAKYLLANESSAIAHKPDGVSHHQAASVGIAAVTALQALRDEGRLQAGERVLINGASGGVGTFAVQMAKSMGAHVTGVCSTRNLDRVRSLGADQVIDYKTDDYTQGTGRYDLIVDMVGNHSPMANAEVLAADGRLIMVGGGKGDWVGPLLGPLQAMLMSPLLDQAPVVLMARLNSADLEYIGQLMQSGKVTPMIDREYPLTQIRDAIAYSESGRARGKIIINIAADGE